MILAMTVELVLVVALFFLAWYFLYRVVPRTGKRVALTMLHDARDRTYKVNENNQSEDGSLICSDALFLLTLMIHIVRDEPKRISLPLIFRHFCPKSQQRDPESSSWRKERYELEFLQRFGDDSGKRDLDKIVQAVREADSALAIYLVMSHPFLMVPTFIFFIISLPFHIYNRLSESIDDSIERTFRTIETLEAGCDKSRETFA